MNLRPLPSEAQRLCDELPVPERLRRHLTLVHDVAADLAERLSVPFPALDLDIHSVLLGASLHDLGKVLHPEELIGPGRRHEVDGPALLERHGMPPGVARFARTHGSWPDEAVSLEDLVVALADNLWKGRRDEELEEAVVGAVSNQTRQQRWAVFERLDDIFNGLTAESDRRLECQKSVDR